MITQTFDLNMIPSSAPVVVHVDQYDHGEGRFIISLYNGDTPYTPTGTAIIQGSKPDGKGFEYSATLSGNTVTANLTEQMTAVYGIVRAQIVITETSGRTGTFVFNMDVQKSALPADADMSHSEYQIVEELLEDVQQAAADAAQSAEDADASAEDSEAWAVGTRDGVPVTSDDPTYHNNSKWWAEHGGGGGGSAHTIVNAKGQDMTNRAALKFANMKVTDDATHNQTVVESGSIITITTTESTLYGQNVTLSDGTTTLTETFSNSGVAVFYGVSLTGNLSISSSDGTDTAIGSLTVPYFGIFEKDISFWSATIAVTTTTADFDGLTVYAKKNGVTKGSAVFSSGSASITVPETGSYTLEVTQDWHTYTSQAVTVSAQTTYNASIDGFKAPISLSTPTTDFYSQNIAVSLDGNPITTSLAFDNTGAASFDALVAGTYVFTLTYQGEPYTATVVVTTETSYSGVIKMWTATIKVTASSQLYSQSVTVYKGSTSVGTVTLDATGKADILVHEAGTYYVKGVYDGWTYSTDAISVSAETDYPVTLDVFICTLSISTTSSELYSQTITVTKGGSTVGTTAFSAQGAATFRVHETGTYTLTCTYGGEDYSESITIVAGDDGTTKSISIETDLILSNWLTEAGLDPSDYADFAAVEADEAAVRKLMTIHDAVDYLATARAGDELMEDVINSDICAKWINLRDYALDTLYANSDIAAEMDTADKYFYGEWCIIDDTTTPVTWGAKGNVPTMTSNTVPYGTASAYQVFDENSGTSASGTDFSYQFIVPVCVRKFESNISDGMLQYSDDGSTWTDISTPSTNTGYHLYYRVHYSSSKTVHTVQFYGREMKDLSPAMTADNAPYNEASASSIYASGREAWKAFDKKSVSGDSTLPASNFTSNDYYLQYKFDRAVTINRTYLNFGLMGTCSYKVHVKGSNNPSGTWDELYVEDVSATGASGSVTNFIINQPINNAQAYQYYRITLENSPSTICHVANTYGIFFRDWRFLAFDYSEYDWDTNYPRKFILDHGLEVMPLINVKGGGGARPYYSKDDLVYVLNGSGDGYTNYSWSTTDDSIQSRYDRLVYIPGAKLIKTSASHEKTCFTRVRPSKSPAQDNTTYNDNDLIASDSILLPINTFPQIIDISEVNQDFYVQFGLGYWKTGTASYSEMWLE